MMITAFPHSAHRRPAVLASLCVLFIAVTAPCTGIAQIPSGAERQVERQTERRVERETERQIERQAERRAEWQAGKHMEKLVSGKIEEHVARTAENRVQNQTERNMLHMQWDTTGIERAAEWNAARIQRFDGQDFAKQLQSNNFQPRETREHSYRNEQIANRIYHNIERDTAGAYRIRDQWLVLTDSRSVKKLEQQGLPILNQTRLEGVNKILVEIAGSPDDLPQGFLPAQKNLESDFNHLYLNQSATANKSSKDIWRPQEALTITGSETQAVAIGLIDSGINLQHEALARANIHARSFIEEGLDAPTEHGTAIASILVGEAEAYHGVLPGNALYAASVFYLTPELGEAASVKSLLLALDWMLSADIKVINMSLAGPPNALIEQMLRKAAQQGVVIIAAAGNNGPGATPVYPAAYAEVLAVTAVNKHMHAWHRANRGTYIDIAAPGVNIFHADENKRFTTSSGTSYAAPFVTAAFAQLLATVSSDEARRFILNNALDLGTTGIDDIYGRGLIHIPEKALLSLK